MIPMQCKQTISERPQQKLIKSSIRRDNASTVAHKDIYPTLVQRRGPLGLTTQWWPAKPPTKPPPLKKNPSTPIQPKEFSTL